MNNNYLIEEKNNLLDLQKQLIGLKFDFKISKNNLKQKYKNNKKDYSSELITLKNQYKSEIEIKQKSLKDAKVKFQSDYNEFKNKINSDNTINEIEKKLIISLSPITDLSYENMALENNNLKKVKRSFKKYDNKPVLTLEERKNRELNKIDYINYKVNYLNSFKCGVKFKKAEKTNKEDYLKYRCLSKEYDVIHYFMMYLKHLICVDNLGFARVIVTVFSILSLALSLSYIRAIQQVTNNWTGLFMFAFILFGLISIFNVIRLKEAYSAKSFFVIGVLLLTIVCGVVLIILTIGGIQAGIRLNRVYQGVILAAIICVGYLIGTTYILMAFFKERKQFKESMI